jgi:hypothetical protein
MAEGDPGDTVTARGSPFGQKTRAYLEALVVALWSVTVLWVLVFRVSSLVARAVTDMVGATSQDAFLAADAVVSFVIFGSFFTGVVLVNRTAPRFIVWFCAAWFFVYWGVESEFFWNGLHPMYPAWYEINMATNQLVAAALAVAWHGHRRRAGTAPALQETTRPVAGSVVAPRWLRLVYFVVGGLPALALSVYATLGIGFVATMFVSDPAKLSSSIALLVVVLLLGVVATVSGLLVLLNVGVATVRQRVSHMVVLGLGGALGIVLAWPTRDWPVLVFLPPAVVGGLLVFHLWPTVRPGAPALGADGASVGQ